MSNLSIFLRRRRRYLPDVLAIAAVCVFVLISTYRIELPGLYMDEVDFVNAARGAPDNTMIHMRLGAVPLFIMPYLGALKAWMYAPVFRLFGVSALTIRLPAIVLAAITLLIFYQLMRAKLGAVWAVITLWIMAVDPANLFSSRLDWGPTVLMHFFQAAIFALWFSYRDRPKLWKIVLTLICAVLGFFDKFNFIWLIGAFVIALCLCYPDALKNLWFSTPRLTRWAATIFSFIALFTALLLVLRVLHVYAGKPLELAVSAKWGGLLTTLSGDTIAYCLFGNNSGIMTFVPFWVLVTDLYLLLGCLFLLDQDAQASENRKDGLFFSLIGFLIFAQIVITPLAGGPHHYLMIFPLPLLAFVFFARPLYGQIATKNSSRFAALLLFFAAACVFMVNVHNTGSYLSRLRTDSQYNPRWSPAIYSLSRYINEHGFETQSIVSVDWGLHNQLHALAPKKLGRKMHDSWSDFQTLAQKHQDTQTTILNHIFPNGKTLALTFAASKETFPDTRRNFLAVLTSHPELKWRLVKEFWYGGDKIYEVYEIDRLIDQQQKQSSRPARVSK